MNCLAKNDADIQKMRLKQCEIKRIMLNKYHTLKNTDNKYLKPVYELYTDYYDNKNKSNEQTLDIIKNLKQHVALYSDTADDNALYHQSILDTFMEKLSSNHSI
jgi:hypothetical protein